jgi:hypothetical protein
MRARVSSYDSADVSDLGTYRPTDLQDFGLQLTLSLVPSEDPLPGGDLFELVVCTPLWQANHLGMAVPVDLGQEEMRWNRGRYLLVARYDWPVILRFIEDSIAICEGETWQEVAECIGGFLSWEFEGYEEGKMRWP